MIDATIIIGLLVLLTLNSISTPFVEEEQSAFFANWYETQQDLRKMDKILLDCNSFLLDSSGDKLWNSFKNSSKLYGTDDTDEDYGTRGGPIQQGSNVQREYEERVIEEWFSSYDENITNRCHELPSEKLELTKKLEVLNNWGIEFNYLEIDSDTSQIVESKYHQDLASGPFITIMTNIGMIIPFLISAIAEATVGSRKKDEMASKVGLVLMIGGFVAMVIGMGIIGFSFYEASAPFLKF